MARSSTTFQKGKSGNPNGRPPAVPEEIKSLCREHTVDAVKTLVDVMRSKKEPGAARAAAANSLLDRGWGKSTQPVSGEDGGPLVIQVIKYGEDADHPAAE